MMYAILFLIGLMSQSNVSVKNTSCDIGITRYSRYMHANTDCRLNETFSKQTTKEYIGFLPNTTDEVYADYGWCLSEKNKLWKCVQEPGGIFPKPHKHFSMPSKSEIYNYDENKNLISRVIVQKWGCNNVKYSDIPRKEFVYEYRNKCPAKETLYEFPLCYEDYEFIRIEEIERKCIWRDNVYYRRNRNGIRYSFATSNRRYGISFLLSGGDAEIINIYGLNCRRFKRYGEIKRNFPPSNQRVIWQSYRELIERMYYIRENFAMGPYTDGFRILPYYVDDEKVGAIY